MSQADYKKQILAFFGVVAGFCVFYMAILVVSAQIFHLPILKGTEIWLDNVYKIKDYINAASTQKQRLIIISGSNSLFGFDSSLIAKHTKYQPINYATHAGLPLNYHIDKIINNAQKGDIIIMPLEFEYYTDDAPHGDIWYVQNMLVWGNGYTKYINAKGVFLAYFRNSPFETAKKIIAFAKNKVLKTAQNPIDKMLKIWEKNEDLNGTCGEFFGYDYKSLTRYGDFCSQENEKPHIVKSEYLKADLQVSQFFVDEFRRLETFAKKNEIKIFLTYPTSAENELFSANNPKTLANIENLKAQLAKNGIKIYGDFRDFHFEQKYFFDTNYHLNKDGATLRTKKFIEFLINLDEI